MNRLRPCWAPIGTRPEVAAQLIPEYIYLYGAVSPKDGTCVYLIMPTSNTACFQAFLHMLARRFARQDILLVLDGAPNHRCGDLAVPNNITLLYLPPYSPELNPKENLWDELREKIFKNYALKSMDAVREKPIDRFCTKKAFQVRALYRLPAFLPPRKSQNIRDWPAQRCVRCYPQAYEDDAERAVRAGLELVAAVSGLKHTHHYTLVSALRRSGGCRRSDRLGHFSGAGHRRRDAKSCCALAHLISPESRPL